MPREGIVRCLARMSRAGGVGVDVGVGSTVGVAVAVGGGVTVAKGVAVGSDGEVWDWESCVSEGPQEARTTAIRAQKTIRGPGTG
jgi:hypothetical protein